MHKTRFAGLTALDAEESLDTDGASFITRNPDLIDHFLEVGVVTHRHDAHAALANPLAQPSGTTLATGGNLTSDLPVYLGYTVLDADGGETAVSPVLALTTDAALDPPSSPLRLTPSYSSGALMADTYYYAVTLADGSGGETLPGPVASVDREPGSPVASITIDGLTDDFAAFGAVAWRLYKAQSGGDLAYYASGATARFVDSGQGCADCGQSPPTTNRTNRTNSLIAVVPGSGMAGASGVVPTAAGFRLYLSLDGSFAEDGLVGEYPVASAGQPIAITSLSVAPGRPPSVSTSVRGARKIDGETELSSLYWKRAVPSSAALPAVPPGSASRGEVRLALDTGLAYASLGSGGARQGGAGWTRLPWVRGIGTASGATLAPTDVRFQGRRGTSVTMTPLAGSGLVQIGPEGRAWASAYTAAVAASGGSGGMSLDLGRSWRLMRVHTDRPARVTLYGSQRKQLDDVGRATGVAPSGNHGVMADITLTNDLAWMVAPAIPGWTDDSDGFTRVSILNLGGSGVVTAGLLFVPQE